MKKRTRLTNQARQEQLQQAMFSLVPNTNFSDFIDFLRDRRDEFIRFATTEKTLSDPRLTMFYLAKVDTYGEIIDTFDDFNQAVEDRAIRAQEHAQ